MKQYVFNIPTIPTSKHKHNYYIIIETHIHICILFITRISLRFVQNAEVKDK